MPREVQGHADGPAPTSSHLVRALVVAMAMATLVACGRAMPPPEGPVSITQAAPNERDALEAARAARDRAGEKRAPSIAEIEAAREEAATEALQRWAAARRDATHEAVQAYTEALRSARDPSEEAEIHTEIAELWLGLHEEIAHAIVAAAPSAYRGEPALVSAVHDDVVSTLRPLRDRAAVHVAACQQIVRETPEAASAARACGSTAERLAQMSGPLASSAPTNAIPSAARPIVPTTYPKPCTLRGTLVTRGAVYADASGGAVLLPITLDAPIEVDAIEVPERSGRYKVSVLWPKAIEGYLEAEEAPFVLKRQVELVPDAAWVAQGERVSAAEARGPTVRITRSFADSARRESPRTASPAALDRRLFCHDLELATTARAATATVDSTEPRQPLRTEVAVPLLAGPNGKEVARIVASDARVLERRGDYAHIAGDAPFALGGWVRTACRAAPPGAK